MKKKYLFITSLLFVFANCNAQEQNTSVKSLLNRTETSIYKGQKQLIAGALPKSTTELVLAVKYQVLAVEAFKANDPKSAVCYSLKAREYTNELFTKIQMNNSYFLLNEDEVKLAAEKNYSSSDESYKTKITADPIEESVLLDPQRLGISYKISTN